VAAEEPRPVQVATTSEIDTSVRTTSDLDTGAVVMAVLSSRQNRRKPNPLKSGGRYYLSASAASAGRGRRAVIRSRTESHIPEAQTKVLRVIDLGPAAVTTSITDIIEQVDSSVPRLIST
jgi:hypothetical protein